MTNQTQTYTNDQPEPCYGGAYCISPVACSAFGYCRERNFASGPPSDEIKAEWRKIAAERKANPERG